MRIFSSGVCLRRAAVLTLQTKDLVSSVRSSAAWVFCDSVWDISAPLCEYSILTQGAPTTSTSRVFYTSILSHFR